MPDPGATENSRLDSGVRYENTVGPIKFGAEYKFAGDKGAQSAGFGWVGMLAFTRGAFSAEGTFSEMTNAVTWPVQYSNVVKPGPSAQVENTKGYMLTLMYTVGKATAKAGWEDIAVSAPSNPNLTIEPSREPIDRSAHALGPFTSTVCCGHNTAIRSD